MYHIPSDFQLNRLTYWTRNDESIIENDDHNNYDAKTSAEANAFLRDGDEAETQLGTNETRATTVDDCDAIVVHDQQRMTEDGKGVNNDYG